ncbi:MAG: RelA/SpoT family protein, partial [Thermodesulfobacteriota bacterium]
RFDGAERFRIARETLDIYAPLANRLGIGWLRIEFEDLAFKSLLPREYADLDKRVALQRDELQTYIDGVIGLVRPRIEAQGIQARISGRVKHSYSIYQKLKRQNIPFEKVYDVMGVRIITETQGECYAVLGLLHGMFTPVPGRLKDFIGAPKSNGYQSLQTTVIGPKGRRVEFQIRTRDMNEVAEKGVAAHWRYKEKEPLSEKDQQVFDSLRRLIQDYKDLQDSRDFLDSVKGDLFSHVVYVFTPDGDLKELPTGATPIDLAYAVHSEVGNRCTGARVNGRIVPLRHELRNGDTVEIITHPGHVPSRDWLKFVKTSKAKNRIRAFIRAEERNQSRALGLQLIEEEMRKHHINPKLLKGERLEEGAASVGFKTSEDLLVSVGYRRFSAHQVVNRLFTDLLKEKAEAAAERVVPSRPEDRKGVRVTGIDNLLYHFSKCCFPLPGDAIVGFVTRGKGVAIHTRDCPNLHMMSVDTDRLIRVEWEGGAEQSHPVRVEVRSKDKPGMLASITASLSAEKVNIERLESGRSRDDTAYYHFVLEVRNKAHLDEVIRKLNQVSGVLEVHRVGTAG